MARGKLKVSHPFRLEQRWQGPPRLIRHVGHTFKRLTRWLPAYVLFRGTSVILDDDFSSFIPELKRTGRRFIIRKNMRFQRAIFVEVR